MKKKHILLIAFVFLAFVGFSQNLVPNPSFETYTNCPQGPSTLGTDVPPWSTPDTATPDYYNVCYTPIIPLAPSMDVPSNIQGYQNARTGDGYAGIISADNTLSINANYREYIQIQLSSPLVAGTEYCIEFYWSLADNSPHYVEEIGVYLSNTVTNLLQSTTLPFTPQLEQTGTPLNDTTNWVPFQQNYTAVGGEQYIIIGNFRTPGNTTLGNTGVTCNTANGGCFAYYYIDDVKVEAGACCISSIDPVNPLCPSDAPVNLNALTPGGTWSVNPATSALNTSTGVFDPSQATPGTYTITYTLTCGSSSIDIEVNSCSSMSVCMETNGDLTVTGGDGPYTWNSWEQGSTTPITNQAECEACGGAWTIGNCFSSFPIPLDECTSPTGWAFFGNGSTVTPPGTSDSIQVVDNLGNTIEIYGLGTVPSCSAACDATITQAGPFCDNDVSTTLNATQAGGTWSGNGITNSSSGAFDPGTAGGGSHVISYSLTCGDTDTMTIVVNPSPNTGTDGATTLCSTDSPIDLFDELGGSPNTGGSWSPALNSGTGIFDPSIDAEGTYTYTITNTCGTSSNDVEVTITSNPNPGTNGVVELCSDASPINLFDSLNGTPDAGGTWSPMLNSGTGVFDPSIDGSGTYTYTLNACAGGTLTAEVQVTIISSLSPGTNGVADLCSNATPINLFDSLSGTPDAGGIWSPTLNSGNGIFDPSIDPAGTYTYSVTGCDGSILTADVIVTTNPTANAGIDGALSICPTDAPTNLFNQLTGNPDTGGIWSPALNSGTGVFDPSIDPAGTYTYTVNNSCGSDNSTVDVTITSNPDPGTNGTAEICSNSTSINLLDSLNGTPDAGGTWSPSLNSGSGVFDPSIDAAGTYTYSLNACGGGSLTSEVVVTINPAANAGIDGNLTLCASDSPIDLFNQLGGSADAGGTWSPSLNSGTGIFDPSIDNSGNYTYSVTNSCGTTSSIVNVTINTCSPPTSLFSQSNDTICEGQCVLFTDQSTGATSWSWTFNGGTPPNSSAQNPGEVCFDATGTVTIELTTTNANGTDTYTSTIEVIPTPTISAGPDITINLNESTQINTSSNATNGIYTWTPDTWLDCNNCPSPNASPEETITYTVIVADSNGCSASDNITVFVEFDNVIFVPNIFSPNNDNVNDILYVQGKGVAEIKFYIYDRWGEKVFESDDLNKGWDGSFRGKEMNKAVFVYYLEATFIDGQKVTQKGDITLVK